MPNIHDIDKFISIYIAKQYYHEPFFFLLPGGAAFIFPNTSVYPEATQRITTRPGMQRCIHVLQYNL